MAEELEWSDISRISDPNQHRQAIDEKLHRIAGDNDRDREELYLAAQQQAIREDNALRNSRAFAAPQNQRAAAGLGQYCPPAENTFAAHYALVTDEKNKLEFSTKAYPYFDDVIRLMYSNQALTNPDHRDYGKYQDARNNLAALRNYLIGVLDSREDLGEQQKQQLLGTMANVIGNAFQTKPFFHWPFNDRMSVNKINQGNGEGAAAMYRLLTDVQERSAIPRPWLWRKPSRRFNLPPIEQTPFGDAGLAAPLPIDGGADPLAKTKEPELLQDSVGLQLAALANEVTARAQRFEAVETLEMPIREEAIAHARNILENFRVEEGKGSIDELIMQDPHSQETKAKNIAGLTAAFESALKEAADSDDAILRNPEIVEARDAIGHLALILNIEALEALQREGDLAAAQIIANQIREFPPEWKERAHLSLEALLAKIEAGLEAVENKKILSQDIAFDETPGLRSAVTQQSHDSRKVNQQVTRDLAMDDQAVARKLAAQAKAGARKSDTRVGGTAAAQVREALEKNPEMASYLQTGTAHAAGAPALKVDKGLVNPGFAATVKQRS